MHRSHSRHTLPADKMLPPSETRHHWGEVTRDEDGKINGHIMHEERCSPGQMKQIKKFHKRKSRQYLKNRLNKDGE